MTSKSNPVGAGPGGGERDRFILHITGSGWWQAQQQAAGGFRDPSLDDEGFIHCSTVEQFLIPANERFAGRDDLLLLLIDTDRLEHAPVYEDCYQSGTAFPHVYGSIPLPAVAAAIDLVPNVDGRFSEPFELRPLLAALTAGDEPGTRSLSPP